MVNETYIPSTLEEALKIRAEVHAKPLAGGSDLMVQYRRGTGVVPVFPFPVMIISGLKELKGIKKEEDGSVVIGALTTSAEIAECEDVPYFVRKAASLMGAISLRNSATIGGNLGNASPKGDLPQPLILLDARVILESATSKREILVDDFIKGSKKTDLKDDEIITAVRIPEVKYTYGYYRKIGTRKANAISKLSMSALLTLEDGVIKDFRVASGAAGPKIARNKDNEAKLIGKKLEDIASLTQDIVKTHDETISPHAMATWRRNTTSRMLDYFLSEVSKGGDGRIIE